MRGILNSVTFKAAVSVSSALFQIDPPNPLSSSSHLISSSSTSQSNRFLLFLFLKSIIWDVKASGGCGALSS